MLCLCFFCCLYRGSGMNIVAQSAVGRYAADNVQPLCSKREAGIQCAVSVAVRRVVVFVCLSVCCLMFKRCLSV